MANLILDEKNLKKFINAEYYIVFEYQKQKYAFGSLLGVPKYLLYTENGYREIYLKIKNLFHKAKLHDGKLLKNSWHECKIIYFKRGKMMEEELQYLLRAERKGREQ